MGNRQSNQPSASLRSLKEARLILGYAAAPTRSFHSGSLAAPTGEERHHDSGSGANDRSQPVPLHHGCTSSSLLSPASALPWHAIEDTRSERCLLTEDLERGNVLEPAVELDDNPEFLEEMGLGKLCVSADVSRREHNFDLRAVNHIHLQAYLQHVRSAAPSPTKYIASTGLERVLPLRISPSALKANLSLCNHTLIEISPSIRLISKLTRLQLCCNQLTKLPDELGHLRHLKILTVAQNRLARLPETIGFLSNLVEFNCENNQITELPSSIARLQKLRILRITNNRIARIPQEVRGLEKLTIFEGMGNPFDCVPIELLRLRRLRTIRIDVPQSVATLGPDVTQDSRESVASTAATSGDRPLSLKELLARQILQRDLQTTLPMPLRLQEYLALFKNCSHCGGPYLEYNPQRFSIVRRSRLRIVCVHSLCVAHWDNEHGRIAAIFETSSTTTNDLKWHAELHGKGVEKNKARLNPRTGDLFERGEPRTMSAASIGASHIPYFNRGVRLSDLQICSPPLDPRHLGR